jgi:hypothetical protein
MKKLSSLAAAAVFTVLYSFPASAQVGAVSGTIRTAIGMPVPGVAISLGGAAVQQTTSGTNGLYGFSDLPAGEDFTITPADGPLLDFPHLNGVSTYDLILFSRHIMGTQLIQNPYTLIALDLNSSGSITILDILLQRRRVLAIDTDPPSPAWYFIRADYVFPVPSNPWLEPFPQSIALENLAPGLLTQQDFIVVQVGNHSHLLPSGFTEVEIRNAPGHTLPFYLDDRQIAPAERFTVAFRSDDLAGMAGFQFIIGFNPENLTLTDIGYDFLGEENFGTTQAAAGKIYTLWYDPAPNAALPSGEVLFRLAFQAKRGGQLSDMLRMEEGPLHAEACDRDLNRHNLSLRFPARPATAERFELLQNAPNPVSDHTVIGFHLPRSSTAVLSISDLQGRVLRVISFPGELDKGYHQFNLPGDGLPAGMLLYTLSAGAHTATRKMMVVR